MQSVDFEDKDDDKSFADINNVFSTLIVFISDSVLARRLKTCISPISNEKKVIIKNANRI